MASITNLVSYELNGVKESFANWISNLSPTDTPFVSMTGKEAVKNKFYQWQEDQLGKYGPNAEAEGSDAGNAKLKATTVRQNVTQILRKVVSVSDTANALSSYGRGKEMQYQLEKAGKEIKRDLEWAFLNQKASVDGTGTLPNPITLPPTGITPATKESSYPGQDDPFTVGGWQSKTPYTAANKANGVRFTAGFEGLVAPLNVASDEDPAAIVHIHGQLTEDNLFKVDEGLYLAGACPDIIMFHPKHAQFFSGLMENTAGTRIRMFDGAVDTKVNKYVSTLVTPLGCTFKLIPNRFMPEDRIYFFRAEDWTQMVLRAPTTQLLAKTGSHDKYMIEMEVGLRHRNQFASGILQIDAATVKTIAGKTNVPPAKAGTTIQPTAIFTYTGGAVPGDYTYALSTTRAGVTVDPATGVVTIAKTAPLTGAITVVPTVKTTGAVVGTPANAVIPSLTAPDLDNIVATPTSLTLSVATDATNGKTVTFAPDPATASLGTLSIKTQPTAAQATASITGTTLTVKPVAAGPATSVVVTNGTKDVTVAVTVTA